MAKYLVAVSGGVDSVVLLDMLVKRSRLARPDNIVVAHVDHGIRGEDSAADARFVRALAKQYKLPFVTTELGLGKKANEEQARDGRYAFLFAEATKLGAQVVTAHHAGDVVETIALNLTRGTGWRGLAVLSRQEVARPLILMTKQQLYEYALRNRLEWVEDATNQQGIYLRNRLRSMLGRESIDTTSLLALRARQLQLRLDIERETTRLVEKHGTSRYFLNMLDEPTAIELLGATLLHQAGKRPARPQLVRALHAVRTAGTGSTCQVGDGISLEFTSRNYRVKVL